MKARRSHSGLTILVAVVTLLVPLLAWLQYRWLGQVNEAERDRMQRTLRTAASQFATAFDSELSRAVAGLQVEGVVARDGNWTAYAQRYSAWAERAVEPRLVREVLLASAERTANRDPGDRHNHERARPNAGAPARVFTLTRWNNDTRVFEPAASDEALASLRGRLEHFLDELGEFRAQPGSRFRREASLSLQLNDDETLVSPVTLFEFADDRRSPPRVDVIGFTIIRLDGTFVRETLLPTLAARHFHDPDGTMDYRLAVTDREDATRVIWESEPGAAATAAAAPDVAQTFMSPRPDQVFMIARGANGERRPGGGPPPPPPPPLPEERIVISVLQERQGARDGQSGPGGATRVIGAFEGRWRLVATHRAGSLDAAVAALRTRNLMLSSGILLLLTLAIGLIVISSRRAQNLARQQMEFVAAVSHELRTPVSVIGTAAGNLADGVVADPARVRKYGETIQGEARRLGETVERVLQLAGIAAGRAAAGMVRLPAADLIQQSLLACRPEIDAAGVTVEVAIEENLPPVEGDAAALRSALQNLISNAVKYGGDAKWLRVTASPAPRQVVFAVEDRGLGIHAEEREQIFEPFYRGREAIARQIQGSGLGLNLVARIAEAHGGRVSVTSEPGKGSTFALTLPAATAAPDGATATVEAEQALAGR
jgi:signal transduction histidine kinase